MKKRFFIFLTFVIFFSNIPLFSQVVRSKTSDLDLQLVDDTSEEDGEVMSLWAINRLIRQRKLTQALKELKLYMDAKPENFDNAQKLVEVILKRRLLYTEYAQKAMESSVNNPEDDETPSLYIMKMKEIELNPPTEIAMMVKQLEQLHLFKYYQKLFYTILNKGADYTRNDQPVSAFDEIVTGFDIFATEFIEDYGEESDFVIKSDELTLHLNEKLDSFRNFLDGNTFDDAVELFIQYVNAGQFDAAEEQFAVVRSEAEKFYILRNQIYESGQDFNALLKQLLEINPEMADANHVSFMQYFIYGLSDIPDSGIIPAINERMYKNLNNMKTAVTKSAQNSAEKYISIMPKSILKLSSEFNAAKVKANYVTPLEKAISLSAKVADLYKDASHVDEKILKDNDVLVETYKFIANFAERSTDLVEISENLNKVINSQDKLLAEISKTKDTRTISTENLFNSLEEISNITGKRTSLELSNYDWNSEFENLLENLKEEVAAINEAAVEKARVEFEETYEPELSAEVAENSTESADIPQLTEEELSAKYEIARNNAFELVKENIPVLSINDLYPSFIDWSYITDRYDNYLDELFGTASQEIVKTWKQLSDLYVNDADYYAEYVFLQTELAEKFNSGLEKAISEKQLKELTAAEDSTSLIAYLAKNVKNSKKEGSKSIKYPDLVQKFCGNIKTDSDGYVDLLEKEKSILKENLTLNSDWYNNEKVCDLVEQADSHISEKIAAILKSRTKSVLVNVKSISEVYLTESDNFAAEINSQVDIADKFNSSFYKTISSADLQKINTAEDASVLLDYLVRKTKNPDKKGTNAKYPDLFQKLCSYIQSNSDSYLAKLKSAVEDMDSNLQNNPDWKGNEDIALIVKETDAHIAKKIEEIRKDRAKSVVISVDSLTEVYEKEADSYVVITENNTTLADLLNKGVEKQISESDINKYKLDSAALLNYLAGISKTKAKSEQEKLIKYPELTQQLCEYIQTNADSYIATLKSEKDSLNGALSHNTDWNLNGEVVAIVQNSDSYLQKKIDEIANQRAKSVVISVLSVSDVYQRESDAYEDTIKTQTQLAEMLNNGLEEEISEKDAARFAGEASSPLLLEYLLKLKAPAAVENLVKYPELTQQLCKYIQTNADSYMAALKAEKDALNSVLSQNSDWNSNGEVVAIVQNNDFYLQEKIDSIQNSRNKSVEITALSISEVYIKEADLYAGIIKNNTELNQKFNTGLVEAIDDKNLNSFTNAADVQSLLAYLTLNIKPFEDDLIDPVRYPVLVQKISSNIQSDSDKYVLVLQTEKDNVDKLLNENEDWKNNPEVVKIVQNFDIYMTRKIAEIQSDKQVNISLSKQAESDIKLAKSARNHAENYFAYAEDFYYSEEYENAERYLEMARQKYYESLTLAEDSDLRASNYSKRNDLQDKINIGKDNVVIRQTRQRLENARAAYNLEDYDRALSIITAAEEFWATTHPLDVNQELIDFKALIEIATSITSGRELNPDDQLYGIISQNLSFANQYFESAESKQKKGDKKGYEADLAQSEKLISDVKLAYPKNQAASILQLKIDRLRDPKSFQVQFDQKIKAAQNKVENGNRDAKNEGYNDLLAYQKLEPNYKNLNTIVYNAGVTMGVIVKPVTKRELVSATRYVENAEKAFKEAKTADDYQKAISYADQAIAMLSENSNKAELERAQKVKDESYLKLAPPMPKLTVKDEALYEQAQAAFIAQNYDKALNLVNTLLKNDSNYIKISNVKRLYDNIERQLSR